MKIDKVTLGIGLVAITVMAASLLVLMADYRSEVENRRAVLLARGETALDALAAGVRAQGRMGRYRGDRLSYVFEELAAAPGILGVALLGADGAIISSGGDTALLTGVEVDRSRWEPTALVLSRRVDLDTGAHGPGQGQGRGAQRFEAEGFVPLPEGPHVLVISLETRTLEQAIAGDRVRVVAVLCGVLVTVLLGAFAATGWLRRRTLNRALVVAREQVAQQQRLALMGAGLAHETKNPLSVVRGHAQLIAESPEDSEENRGRAERIVDEIDRTVRHINGFLALSRPREVERVPVNLGPFLARFAELMEAEARDKGVVMTVESGDITVRADEGQLRKALLNLVLNALEACRPGNEVEIVATAQSGKAALTVRDTGRGIAPEDLARVTEPYFTRSEKGCGLGLALVQQIADGHGWTLDIRSAPGEGTSVSLRGLERVS